MPTTNTDKKSAGAKLAESIVAEIGEEELQAALSGEDLFADDAVDAPADTQQDQDAGAGQGATSDSAKSKPSARKGKAAKGSGSQKSQGKAQGASNNKGGSKSAAEAIAAAISVVAPEAKAAEEEWAEAGEIDEERLAPIRRPNGQVYRPRPVANLTDVELLRKAREEGIPVLLAGYPGTGKTALVEAAFDGEVITMNGNADMEKADFMGSYVFRAAKPGEQPEPVWVDGPLVRAMKEGKVLFVDDTTLVPANVISVLYPLMDGRNRIVLTDHESEEIVAAPGFYVCGAHNPGAPGSMLAEALSSRFGIQMTVESDLALAHDYFEVDPRVVKVAADLRTMRAEGTVSWAPEMRELLAFKRNADAFGIQVAVNNLIGVAPEDARDELRKRLIGAGFRKAETLRHSE